MRTEDLFAYLKQKIKIGTELQLIVEDISFGDRYYNEQGESIDFTIAGKKYSVGYSHITEDADDWAQAESHQVSWCYCEGKHIEPSELLEIVRNWKLLEREYKLNKLL